MDQSADSWSSSFFGGLLRGLPSPHLGISSRKTAKVASPWKVADEALKVWGFAPAWEVRMESLTPSFSLAQSWLLRPFVINGWKTLSVCVQSITLWNKLSFSENNWAIKDTKSYKKSWTYIVKGSNWAWKICILYDPTILNSKNYGDSKKTKRQTGVLGKEIWDP